jgi:hypothetical protein
MILSFKTPARRPLAHLVRKATTEGEDLLNGEMLLTLIVELSGPPA